MNKGKPEESRGGQGEHEPEDAQSSDPSPTSDDPAARDQKRPTVISPDSSDDPDLEENAPSTDGDLDSGKEITEVLRYEVQQRLHFRGTAGAHFGQSRLAR